MDSFFPGNSMTNISNARIDNINSESGTTFVTISYTDCAICQDSRQTVRLVVRENTLIFDERGNIIPVRNLRVGMIINATISSAMTRSIPPQAFAYIIRIIRRPQTGNENTTTGRIIDINRQNQSFMTISDGNLSSRIRFNITPQTIILNRNGRPISFDRLVPGLRVRVRHANFMTASIPPQTTAFEVRIL